MGRNGHSWYILEILIKVFIDNLKHEQYGIAPIYCLNYLTNETIQCCYHSFVIFTITLLSCTRNSTHRILISCFVFHCFSCYFCNSMTEDHTSFPSGASPDALVDTIEVWRLIDFMDARHIGHVSSWFAQSAQKPRC